MNSSHFTIHVMGIFIGQVSQGPHGLRHCFGVVAKARDRRTGETVAVKWIHGGEGDGEDGAARLRAAVLREAGCLDACRGHPSIVELRGVAADEATGDLFLVMEFVGPSLQRRLTGPFSEAEARACIR